MNDYFVSVRMTLLQILRHPKRTSPSSVPCDIEYQDSLKENDEILRYMKVVDSQSSQCHRINTLR